MKLLKQLLLSKVHLPHVLVARNVPNAADVPTLLGTGSFSLLGCKFLANTCSATSSLFTENFSSGSLEIFPFSEELLQKN